MLPRENHLFGCTGPKPGQDSVPTGLTVAGDFGFCFQCEMGSSLALRRPIETAALTRKVNSITKLSDNALNKSSRQPRKECGDATPRILPSKGVARRFLTVGNGRKLFHNAATAKALAKPWASIYTRPGQHTF